MTRIFLLDWEIQAVSLFNVILLTWLGLTVLLNAERRKGGILLAGGGLLMGGAFFICHSAILGYDPNAITSVQDFWWYVGWAPVIFLPFAWYLVMLWYTGYWEALQAEDETERRLYYRQRFWFVLTILFGLILFFLLFFARLLPPLSQLAQINSPILLSSRSVPLIILVYPFYALLCMGLALDTLLHPGPSRRWLGDLARRRAQPWLLAASILLLVVSLIVGWVMLWIVANLGKGIFSSRMFVTVGSFDLLIAGLIGLSVVVLGQAVVSYEIFTARTLPRNGLLRQWRSALILAAGYSQLVAWSLAIHLRSIYSLLLTTLLMAVFFALLVWRSYADRERFIKNLRPFLVGSGVYAHILDSHGEKASMDASGSFQVLCREVLETGRACLAPVGEMEPLAGPPISFPDAEMISIPPLAGLVAEFQSPDDKGLPLDPGQYDGFIWVVPLWSERGLIGMLLLGEKRTGGFYTQEEIEVARAAGERLVDLKASTELARRLAILERQHLTQSQVMDQQTRRVLHDEILPLIHTALLNLSSETDPIAMESIDNLSKVHKQLSDLLHSMAATTSPDVSRLGLLGALHQVVERDLVGSFDRMDWQVEAGIETQIRALPNLEAEVLFFAAREVLRNAARYGQPKEGEPSRVVIRFECKEKLVLVIEDNGAGFERPTNIDLHQNNVMSGQGLAIHSTLMAVIGGSLIIENNPGQSTRVVLSLPTTGWHAK